MILGEGGKHVGGKGAGPQTLAEGTMWIAGRDWGEVGGVGEIRKTGARGVEGQREQSGSGEKSRKSRGKGAEEA